MHCISEFCCMRGCSRGALTPARSDLSLPMPGSPPPATMQRFGSYYDCTSFICYSALASCWRAVYLRAGEGSGCDGEGDVAGRGEGSAGAGDIGCGGGAAEINAAFATASSNSFFSSANRGAF